MLKKIILIALIISALGLSGCVWAWMRYYNREYDFSLIIPRFWEKEEVGGAIALILRSPLKGRGDKYRENLTVAASILKEKVPLDIVYEVNKAEILRAVPGIKYDINEGSIFAGMYEGKLLSFINSVNGMTIRIQSAVWVKDTKVYTISCSGESETFFKYDPVFKKVMNSLRIK